MFKTGDIVSWPEDFNFWIIIEKDFPSESDPNVYLWRMRRKNDQGRLPKCMVAWSNQLNFICRPCFLPNQELIYRRYLVKIIKDTGIRVQCKTIGILDGPSPGLFNFNPMVGRQLEILRSALVESNISTFTR